MVLDTIENLILSVDIVKSNEVPGIETSNEIERDRDYGRTVQSVSSREKNVSSKSEEKLPCFRLRSVFDQQSRRKPRSKAKGDLESVNNFSESEYSYCTLWLFTRCEYLDPRCGTSFCASLGWFRRWTSRVEGRRRMHGEVYVRGVRTYTLQKSYIQHPWVQ